MSACVSLATPWMTLSGLEPWLGAEHEVGSAQPNIENRPATTCAPPRASARPKRTMEGLGFADTMSRPRAWPSATLFIVPDVLILVKGGNFQRFRLRAAWIGWRRRLSSCVSSLVVNQWRAARPRRVGGNWGAGSTVRAIARPRSVPRCGPNLPATIPAPDPTEPSTVTSPSTNTTDCPEPTGVSIKSDARRHRH